MKTGIKVKEKRAFDGHTITLSLDKPRIDLETDKPNHKEVKRMVAFGRR